MKTKITGVGGYLPSAILTNFDLEKMVDTSDAWIKERTGICQRHIAAEGELTSDLAIQAAKEALKTANISAAQLDLIILATTTPDNTLPATAVKVQYALGATKAFAFDLQAVCSGFMYAMATAHQYIQTGAVRTALVIGAETISRLLDWTDRNTCVLFGDGAGAVVLSATPDTDAGGLEKIILHSDGAFYDMLHTTGGVSSTKNSGFIYMQGREVFRHAVVKLAGITTELLNGTSYQLSDIDYLLPHQANLRIIQSVADKINIPMEKVALTLPFQGNTSAASIPLALHWAVQNHKVKPGDLILTESMGGGFTWGGALIRL